jgi:hypothetical protein
MDTTTAVVLLAAIVLFSVVLLFALYKKGDLKAGGAIGHGSFFLEVKDRKEDGAPAHTIDDGTSEASSEPTTRRSKR